MEPEHVAQPVPVTAAMHVPEINVEPAPPQPAMAAPAVTLNAPGEQPMKVTGNLYASPIDIRSPSEPWPLQYEPPSPSMSNASFPGFPQDKQNEMRVRWEEAMHRNLEIPDGYHRVGVLIVKWDDALTDLKNTAEEVNRLETLFKEDFGFETQIVELHNRKNPNIQLTLHVASFVEEYDSRDSRNLIIVYYTGHGVWNEDGCLFDLTSTSKDWPVSRETHPPRACWNSAERALLDASCDVLTIFDTCLASNLMREDVISNVTWTDCYQYNGIFEHMSATGMYRLAPVPGPKSFTHHLIEALGELLTEYQGRPFSTFHLQQKMAKARARDPPWIWNRRSSDEEHIRIGPLHHSTATGSPRVRQHNPDAAFLALRFELDHCDLGDAEIEYFTQELAKACRTLKAHPKAPMTIRRVDWRGMRLRRHPRDHLHDVVHKVRQTNGVVRRLSNMSDATQDAQPVKRKWTLSEDGPDDSWPNPGAGNDHRDIDMMGISNPVSYKRVRERSVSIPPNRYGSHLSPPSTLQPQVRTMSE